MVQLPTKNVASNGIHLTEVQRSFVLVEKMWPHTPKSQSNCVPFLNHLLNGSVLG